MSLIFTHNDRTTRCDHKGTLGRQTSDGTSMCVRCGELVFPPKKEIPSKLGTTLNSRNL